MKHIEKQLDKIESEIQAANTEKNQAEGAVKQIRDSIKKTFKISTDKEIRTKIKQLEGQLDSISTEIETKFQELQENYSW